MKQIEIMGIILLCVSTITKSYAQSEAAEQLIVPLSSPGKPYTLKVNLMTGSIKVASYEGKDIIIDLMATGSNIGMKPVTTSVNNGMKRIPTSGNYEVTAKENDNTVTVNNSNINKAFNLNFKIPQDVKLKLSTVINGNIEVENIKGELEVTNVNGAIKLINISGSVVANTVNGDITATFNMVDTKAPMAFSTLIGNINVTLPVDTKANLKLKSDMGEIYSDFDIVIDKTQPKINKINEPGMYKIKMEDWIYGKINGGGSEILMKNMQGNIYMKKGAN